MRSFRGRFGKLDTGEIHEAWQPKLWLVLVALALTAAYLVAFVVENRKAVPVHFVFATARIPLIWTILLTLGIGLLAGLLLSQVYRWRHRRREAPRAD
jgi:uncharacterized integral membrane protein